MESSEFYKKLNLVYPRATGFIPLFLMQLFIIYYAVFIDTEQPIILFGVCVFVIWMSYFLVKGVIARKTIIDLFNAKDYSKLVRHLLFEYEKVNSQPLSTPINQVNRANKIKALILFLDPDALTNYDRRSPQRKLEEYFFNKIQSSKKDSKVMFIMLFMLNVLLIAVFLYDYLVLENPVYWAAFAFNAGGINLFFGCILLVFVRRNKKEYRIIEQYKTNVDAVIKYYQDEKRKSTRIPGMLKKEKQKTRDFYDNIIQLLLDYKQSLSENLYDEGARKEGNSNLYFGSRILR